MALFIHVPEPLSPRGGGDLEKRVGDLESILTELIKQLNYCISNLGADNVMEAGSVEAKNINTDNGKIASDQIKNIIGTKIVNEKGEPLIEFINGTAFFKGMCDE